MMSSTLRIISAASVADKTTCALTYMSHQHHVIDIAQTARLKMQVHYSKCLHPLAYRTLATSRPLDDPATKKPLIEEPRGMVTAIL